MCKSFILYQEYKENISLLSQSEKGDLLDAIFDYNDGIENELKPIVKMAFSFIKADLARNRENYEKKQKERSTNGRIGNLKRHNLDLYNKFNCGDLTLEEAENTAKTRKTSPSDNSDRKNSPSDNSDRQTRLYVNVNDNVNDNVNGNNNSNNNHNNKTPPIPPQEKGVGVLKHGFKRGWILNDVLNSLNDEAERKVKKNAPGWCMNHLANVYIAGINSGKREPPDSIAKAFPAWCKVYTKGKSPL